jgi:AcrR family transcriptional regulator
MDPDRGVSTKAQHTASLILNAAEELMIEEGYHNFSIRKVATKAGVTVGNLQYHFATKAGLIEAMLDHCIDRYLELFARVREESGDNPRKQLKHLVHVIFADLNTRTTTHFFPELWSLSNHEGYATELMDDMYAKYRAVLVEVIQAINPRLKRREADGLALFMSASMEGHTVFVGHNKPWQQDTRKMADLAVLSFLHLIDGAA